jgi:hypothetical protein
MDTIQKAARALGRKGGRSRSEAKVAAARANAVLGGRPRTYPPCALYRAHRWNVKTGKCPCGQQRQAALECVQILDAPAYQ